MLFLGDKDAEDFDEEEETEPRQLKRLASKAAKLARVKHSQSASEPTTHPFSDSCV
jgi:hypothetical protein